MSSEVTDLRSVTSQTFAEQLNTRFSIESGPSDAEEMELIEATEKQSSPTQEQFSLIFRAASDTVPNQGQYTMKHEKLGVLELFLVPVGKDDKGLYYEAFFNRLRKKAE
jgi:hypothetical protein